MNEALDHHGGDLLSRLGDDVLSLVYGFTYFRELRPRITPLLVGQPSASLPQSANRAFELFVMQVQCTAKARPGQERIGNQHRGHRSSVSASDVEIVQRAWGHRWLLTPASVQVEALDAFHNSLVDTHLVDIVQLLYEFGCVDIAVVDDAPSLSLRSTVSFCWNRSNEGM